MRKIREIAEIDKFINILIFKNCKDKEKNIYTQII